MVREAIYFLQADDITIVVKDSTVGRDSVSGWAERLVRYEAHSRINVGMRSLTCAACGMRQCAATEMQATSTWDVTRLEEI